jgi:hypothetical protein
VPDGVNDEAVQIPSSDGDGEWWSWPVMVRSKKGGRASRVWLAQHGRDEAKWVEDSCPAMPTHG